MNMINEPLSPLVENILQTLNKNHRAIKHVYINTISIYDCLSLRLASLVLRV